MRYDPRLNVASRKTARTYCQITLALEDWESGSTMRKSQSRIRTVSKHGGGVDISDGYMHAILA